MRAVPATQNPLSPQNGATWINSEKVQQSGFGPFVTIYTYLSKK